MCVFIYVRLTSIMRFVPKPPSQFLDARTHP